MARHGHKLCGFCGQASLNHSVLKRLRQSGVGMQGFAAAAQDNGVASLDAQNGCVNGDIGAGFVNHGDNAKRNAHFAHQQAVGALPLAFGSAYRIGQVGDVGAGGAHFFHNGGSEREAVKAGGILPGSPCGLNVAGVGRQNGSLAFAQKFGQSQKRPVFGFGRSPGHGTRRVFCLRAKARHFFSWRHASSLWQRPRARVCGLGQGIFVLTEGLFVAYEEDFRPESVLTCALCMHDGNGGDFAPKEFLIHESAKESRRGRRAPVA